ncbi:MAG: SRPBCC family protein [Alphaproteobacteria bacterium]|nr:SRPBCC family protein [Alphaproteobacteria bacterium]
MEQAESTSANEHELVIDLVLDAPRHAIYRCWTEPKLLIQWFTPKPWSTVRAELDVRPGGASNVTMRSPEGEETLHPGVYLEVVPNERLVFTDAFGPGWTPKEGPPFMVGSILLSDEADGKTRYVAKASHWTKEAREQHEKMGFHEGWTAASRQLEALARTI